MVLPSSDETSILYLDHNSSVDSNEPGQYLELTLSSFSGIDFVESQQQELRSVPAPVPEWLSEFIREDFLLFESDDPQAQADAMSVSETSSPAKVDTNGIADAVPLFALPSEPVPVSFDIGAMDNTDINRWLSLTDSGALDLGTILGSNVQDANQNVTEQVYSVLGSSCSESPLEKEFHRPFLEPQNDANFKVMVPRRPCVICPICKLSLSSESQARKHLRNRHSPAHFTCAECSRRFKLLKDLQRHITTHDPMAPRFACSCGSSFARRDGVLRHINTMAKIDTEVDHHKAAKSISK